MVAEGSRPVERQCDQHRNREKQSAGLEPRRELDALRRLPDNLVFGVSPVFGHDGQFLTSSRMMEVSAREEAATSPRARSQGVGHESRPVPARHPATKLDHSATPEGSIRRGTDAVVT